MWGPESHTPPASPQRGSTSTNAWGLSPLPAGQHNHDTNDQHKFMTTPLHPAQDPRSIIRELATPTNQSTSSSQQQMLSPSLSAGSIGLHDSHLGNSWNAPSNDGVAMDQRGSSSSAFNQALHPLAHSIPLPPTHPMYSRSALSPTSSGGDGGGSGTRTSGRNQELGHLGSSASLSPTSTTTTKNNFGSNAWNNFGSSTGSEGYGEDGGGGQRRGSDGGRTSGGGGGE